MHNLVYSNDDGQECIEGRMEDKLETSALKVNSFN